MRPTPLATAVPTPDPATAATFHLYRVLHGMARDGIGNNNVYLDGVLVGRANGAETLAIPVAPGLRELSIVPEMKGVGLPSPAREKQELKVVVEPTRKYYFRYGTFQSTPVFIGRLPPFPGRAAWLRSAKANGVQRQ